MSRNMNPITVCCAAVLMLGLAACGSDNGADMADMPSSVAVDLTGVADDAARAAGMEEIAAGESATIGEITFTCAAGGPDCTVTVAADGSATATGGMVTADNSAAYATRKAEIARATEAAKTKQDAMATEALQAATGGTPGIDGAGGADAGLGGSAVTATGNAAGAYNLDIERDHEGTTVTVTVEGATDAGDEDFELAMDLRDGRSMHTRTMDADADGNMVTEVVIVATDIEAPRATAFGMVHPLEVRVDGETATDTMPNDALYVADANLGQVSADAFTAPAGTVDTTILRFQHEVEDNAATPEDESRDAAEIAGTFDGAMGTYKCNATGGPCTVTVDTMGVVSAVDANHWIFIPDAGVTIDVPDSDYLHYGFWLKRTTASDGAVTYNEVETFAGSPTTPESGTMTNVTGTASYEGGAVGVYAITTEFSSTTGKPVDASSGHFKARARLEATFGQTAERDIPPYLLHTLTGTIDDFKLQHGEPNEWSVTLQSDGDPNTAGNQPNDTGTHSGTAKGSGDNVGSFSATFHGSTGSDGTTQPGAVVGEFNADFSNGRVAGAFGATKPRE